MKTGCRPILDGDRLWLKPIWGVDGKSQYGYREDGKKFIDFGDPV